MATYKNNLDEEDPQTGFVGNTDTPYSGGGYTSYNMPTLYSNAGTGGTYDQRAAGANRELASRDKPYSEYWMNEGQRAWDEAGTWGRDNLPGEFTWDQQAPPEWDRVAPTFEGIDEFDTEGWTGEDAFKKYMGMLKSSGAGWTDISVDPFNADAAFNKYLEGAQMKEREVMKTEMDRLSQNAAGRGRLNTGFFDLDRGELGRQISTDYRSDAMMKALDTNRQQLDYIMGKANVGLQNNQGRMNAASNAYGMLSGDRDFAMRGWTNKYNMAADIYGSKADAYRQDYGASRDIRSDYESDRNFGADTYKMNFDRYTSNRDWLGGRATDANQAALDWRDRYWDTSTGLRQEQLGKEEAAKERKQSDKNSKRNFWGGIIGGVLGAASKFIPGL